MTQSLAPEAALAPGGWQDDPAHPPIHPGGRMYDGILAESIKLDGHGGDLIEAYFARPLGPGPYPGVVVIHHMPGYDASTKEITRTFAVQGYAAVCPNLYWREAPGAEPDDAAATVRAAG